jgi:signal transduction histidine kinase
LSTSVPMSDGLYVSALRPNRGRIRWFVRYYSFTVGLIVTAIIFLSLYEVSPLLTGVFISAYWLYMTAKHLFRHSPRWIGYYRSASMQFARALGLVAGVTVLLHYLHKLSGPSAAGSPHSAWLLYLLPLFIMSQRASTGHLILTVVIAEVAMYLVEPVIGASLFQPVFGKAVTSVTIAKAFWLLLPALVLYIFIRYLGDSIADLQLIAKIQERLRELERDFIHELSEFNVATYLTHAVAMIVDDFGYDHVNVFRLRPGRQALDIVAGGSANGKALIADGFVLDLNARPSVIGQVITTRKSYLSNSVAKDPNYLPHSAFPRTKSELAVPIRFRKQLYGVLDVQVNRRAYFLDQDVSALEILANHIGWVIDNAEQFQHLNWVDEVLEDIAESFLTQDDLEETLREIARAAARELGANLVTLYCYGQRADDSVIGPIIAGTARYPDVLAQTRLGQDNVVHRMRYYEDEMFVCDDLGTIDLQNHPLLRPSIQHVTYGRPTFIEREEIRSHAIVRLMSESACVGVLFLNFRQPRVFTEWDKRRYFSFAHLGALAIQKMQAQHRKLRLERADLANSIHDMLIGDSLGLHKLLNSLRVPTNETERAKLEGYLSQARDMAGHLSSDIRQISGLLRQDNDCSLTEEVERLRSIYSMAFNTHVECSWQGNEESVPRSVAESLRYVLREATTNAIRHGEAEHIKISVTLAEGGLHMVIEDNGCGFQPQSAKWGTGLRSMKERVQRLRGTLQVISSPDHGTSIEIDIPPDGLPLVDHTPRTVLPVAEGEHIL